MYPTSVRTEFVGVEYADKHMQRRMKVKCLNCDKEFEVQKWVVEGGRKFCSYECYWKYRRRRVKRICAVCQKEFEVLRSEIERGRGKFCSKECYEEYRKGKEYKRKNFGDVKEIVARS